MNPTTFGAAMRELLAERGLSLRGLAKIVHFDNAYLSRVANDRQAPSPKLAAALDDALDANGELLAAATRGRPWRAPATAETPLVPAVNGRPVDAAYVETLRETSQALVKLDTLQGANDIFPLALRVFRQADRRLGAGAYDPSVERDLMAATGEAGEVAAWLAYDADRQDASRQIIQEALLLSRQAGDRDMELFQLAHLAMQSTFLHRPAEALRISDGVLDSVKLAPRVAALFDIRRGRALAQMGDQQRAFAALDKAAGALAEGVSAHDPRWTWWITDAEITWHRGMAYADLGQWRTSVPLFQESFEQRAAYRRAQYNDQAHLLNALAHLHAWHDAEPIVVQLVELAAEVGSARTANLLRRVAKRIGRTEDVPSTVADAAAALT